MSNFLKVFSKNTFFEEEFRFGVSFEKLEKNLIFILSLLLFWKCFHRLNFVIIFFIFTYGDIVLIFIDIILL